MRAYTVERWLLLTTLRMAYIFAAAYSSPYAHVAAEPLDQHLLPPSSITSSFQSQGHQSCTDLLLQTYTLACQHVAEGPEVRVKQCSSPGGAEGFILLLSHHKAVHKQHHRNLKVPIFENSNLYSDEQRHLSTGNVHNTAAFGNYHNHHGHHIYRIRIVGREVVVPPIQYCGSITVAQYSLSFPGSYHVEVLHLHNNFSFAQPTPVRQNIHAVDFTLHVYDDLSGTQRTGVNKAQRHSASKSSGAALRCQARLCPVCGHSVHGRWLVKDAAVEEQLHHTCVAFNEVGQCDWFNSTFSMDESGQLLQWQPYGCSYASQTASTLSKCMSKLTRPVCFIGDSQTRHLHLMVTKALCSVDGSTASTCAAIPTQAINASNATTIKSVAESDLALYVEDRWGSLIDTTNCSHVFWNFGQWPLSYLSGTDVDPTNVSWAERPWSIRHYVSYVDTLAQHMVLQQQKHDNMHYWMTINSHPLTRRQQDPGDDWRTTPMLLLYNKVAATVMDKHGIAVVDTFSIADPLFDVSYDGAHYLGAAGQMQAQLVLHVVCRPHPE